MFAGDVLAHRFPGIHHDVTWAAVWVPIPHENRHIAAAVARRLLERVVAHLTTWLALVGTNNAPCQCAVVARGVSGVHGREMCARLSLETPHTECPPISLIYRL